jgi:NADPH2:quinone reductase
MKAILLRRPGGPEALEYVEVPTPVPGEGKVLVKADTIGVSMPEVLVRRGTYAWMPALPAIPGIELSGTVVAHGPNTAEPALGQPVFVSARDLPARAGCLVLSQKITNLPRTRSLVMATVPGGGGNPSIVA